MKKLKYLLLVSLLTIAGCSVVSGYKFDYNAVDKIELGSDIATVENILQGKAIEITPVEDGQIAKWEYAVNEPNTGWPYIRTVKLAFDNKGKLVRAVEINGIEVSDQTRKRLLSSKI